MSSTLRLQSRTLLQIVRLLLQSQLSAQYVTCQPSAIPVQHWLPRRQSAGLVQAKAAYPSATDPGWLG
jgi:hypothetical protein